jgi:hypothetical protein
MIVAASAAVGPIVVSKNGHDSAVAVAEAPPGSEPKETE